MTRKLTIAVALIGVIGLSACSDTPDTLDEIPTTLPDIPTTLPDAADVQDLVADIQTEMDDIASEMENSEAADDLRAAWDEIEAEIQSAVTSATEEGAVDTTELEQQFQEFEDTLTALGDDVSDELMSSWNALRRAFDQLTN